MYHSGFWCDAYAGVTDMKNLSSGLYIVAYRFEIIELDGIAQLERIYKDNQEN